MDLEKDLQRDFAGQPQVQVQAQTQPTINTEMPTAPMHQPNVISDVSPPPYYPTEIQNPNVTNTIRPFNAGFYSLKICNELLLNLTIFPFSSLNA